MKTTDQTRQLDAHVEHGKSKNGMRNYFPAQVMSDSPQDPTKVGDDPVVFAFSTATCNRCGSPREMFHVEHNADS